MALKHLHSPLRYFVLLFIVLALFKAISGLSKRRAFDASDNRMSLLAMVLGHIQLLVGLLLYFVSPIVKVGFSDVGSAMGDPQVRFFLVEHSLMMLAAIALLTIGRISSKKASEDEKKFRKIALFYGLALLVIFVSIPWPFLKDFGTWF